ARKLFPNAVLHWEDFGSTNARRILDKYRAQFATFNDDVQGTGAIVLAGLLNAVKLSKTPWTEQRVVVFGAGTAGCGIADQIRDQMIRSGLTREEAISRIWLVDLPGLLTSDMTDDLLYFQKDYVKDIQSVSNYPRKVVDVSVEAQTRWPAMANILAKSNKSKGIIDLASVIEQVKPTILIGTSTQPGAFTESIVRNMASNVEHPIIFPLSNPTLLHEATPQHLIEWTDGRVFVATGAPFDDVIYKDVCYKIGQANNAALYPGLGFGAIVSQAEKITDEMIFSAVQAVASQATLGAQGASLLPSNEDLRITSSIVALEVMRMAKSQGVAKVDPTLSEVEVVRTAAWWPVYLPVEAI
ncbi:oxaloacetate-decarboxylating malate dehydrogenase, partial [Providencia stuartii]|uniref:oxaloacetate-decarboxylating malate dehydrogenase n=3 Tax=Providencia TaxID=586 RepID=UPI003CF83C83